MSAESKHGRLRGPGLYSTINLGAHRVDDLRATHRDANPLPVVPDSKRTAEELVLRATRDLGVGPMEELRRYLDSEARRSAARLAEIEKRP